MATRLCRARELHTPQQREDCKRRSRGRVSFLERRMYENYLLDPEAIAEVLNHAAPSGCTHITASEVEEWLRSHGQAEKFLESNARDYAFPEEAWYTEVHGARALATLFEKFSEGCIAYQKVQHGMKLTRWLLAATASIMLRCRMFSSKTIIAAVLRRLWKSQALL